MRQDRTMVITLLLGTVCAGAWYLSARQEHLDRTPDSDSMPSSADTVIRQDGDPRGEHPVLAGIEPKSTGTAERSEATTPGEPASTPEGVTHAFSHEDVLQIQGHLDLLYATADREALLQGYKDVMRGLPDDFATEAHERKLASGDFTIVGQSSPAPTEGDDVVRVPTGRGGSREAFGLVRVHRLEGGEMVETEIELDELGEDAVIAVKAAWFQANIGRRK